MPIYEIKFNTPNYPATVYEGEYELVQSGVFEVLVKKDYIFDTLPVSLMFCRRREQVLHLSGQVDEDFNKMYSIRLLPNANSQISPKC